MRNIFPDNNTFNFIITSFSVLFYTFAIKNKVSQIKHKIMNRLFILLTLTVLFFIDVNAEQKKYVVESDTDGLPLSVMVVTSDNAKVKGILQIVHGMAEHKERYIPFMEFMANNGYACVIHDHRGHGASILSSDDLGYFYDGGYEAMIADAIQIGEWMQQQYPEVPLYLFGHSMGSMVVRSYTKRYDKNLDGLIVCGSPSYNIASGVGIRLSAKAARKYGDHYRSEKLHKLSFGSFNKNIKDATSSNSWICTDIDIVNQYDDNPLCNFVFTTNGFENLFRLMRDTYDKENWKMENPELPILFIAGKDDPCIVNQCKFNKAVRFMEKRGYSNVHSKLYDNMRHEILNEIEKEKVWNDILATLNYWNK